MSIPALVLEWLEYKTIDHEEISRDDQQTDFVRNEHRLYAAICRDVLEKLKGLDS